MKHEVTIIWRAYKDGTEMIQDAEVGLIGIHEVIESINHPLEDYYLVEFHVRNVENDGK